MCTCIFLIENKLCISAYHSCLYYCLFQNKDSPNTGISPFLFFLSINMSHLKIDFVSTRYFMIFSLFTQVLMMVNQVGFNSKDAHTYYTKLIHDHITFCCFVFRVHAIYFIFMMKSCLSNYNKLVIMNLPGPWHSFLRCLLPFPNLIVLL